MDGRRALRVWSRVISPAIPIAFAAFLGVVCSIRAAVDPGTHLWVVLAVICAVIVVGGISAIAILRRRVDRRAGR